MIRVASYNIRRGLGTDLKVNLSRTLAVLHELDAAVIAIQEGEADLARLLASRWPRETRFSALRLQKGELAFRGNLLLLRDDVTVRAVSCFDLPSVEQQRGAIVAVLEHEGKLLRVIGMHLSLLGGTRARQAEALLEHVQRLEPIAPIVMLGDLNEWNSHSRALASFAANHTLLAPGASYHAKFPFLALDRIIISRDVAVLSAGVHRSGLTPLASDHLPVWADLELPGVTE